MADKHNSPATSTAQALTADQPESVRNVVLVGPSGSGKTTLIEALLVAAGMLPRPGRVEDGSTVSDFDEVEHRQGRSVGLALAPLAYNDLKINLLDSPGYADFVGELRAGLRAADCALFVLSAADGVDGATRAAWQECAAVGMPRAVVITKLDHQRADYDTVLAETQQQLCGADGRVRPLYLPVEGGLLGLLTQTMWRLDGGTRVEADPPAQLSGELEAERAALIESIIEESEDESLMDRYLGGETIDTKVLIDDLEQAIEQASFFPVIPASAYDGLGMVELLEVISNAFPPPSAHPMPDVFTQQGKSVTGLSCDPDGDLVAEVVKTTSDPYVGRISLVRVFSGTIRPDSVLHVSGHFSAFFGDDRGHADHDEDEKVGALFAPLGKSHRPLSHCVAGDLCAIGKLSRAETGDTLSAKERPLVLKPWAMPEALLPIAIQARAKADEDKLSLGLSRLAAEDPSLRVEQNTETHQLVLWCMGDAHADVLLDRLANRYGVQVDQVPLRVPLRETFSGKATAKGRHVKQSGGHGQFGICDIEVEPLPEGSGFEFVDKVVGGSVPRQFIPSVEKGVRTQMERGVRAGYPVVDLRVTLVDGKAHSVDSSDMAFQQAGQLALKEAAKAADVAMLEPVDLISVLVDDDYVGSVMGDLSSRRGRVLGTEPLGDGRTMVKAEVPQLEIITYASELRSISHGTGTFTREYVRYEPMPTNVAAKVSAAQEESA